MLSDHGQAALDDWFQIQKIWKPGGLKEAHAGLDLFIAQAMSGELDKSGIQSSKDENEKP